MLDVETHLQRFSPEKQSQLFEAFQSVSQILDDADIIKASKVGASASKMRLLGNREKDRNSDAVDESNPELTTSRQGGNANDTR
jgi:hypothetical protein